MKKIKKKIEDNTHKDVKSLFRLKKEKEAIKGKKIIDIRKRFELENEGGNYYKPIRVDNFQSNNYIKYQSNGDRNKILSIRPYLKRVINVS